MVARDLYQINFNLVFSFKDLAGQLKGQVAGDVKQNPEFITRADCITCIYPIWRTVVHANMKGYIDRVFSYDFAYRYDKGLQIGLLTGKQTIITNTHGKSGGENEAIRMDEAMVLTSGSSIYSYAGLDIQQHFLF